MCVTDPELKCGDGQWQILAKILERLKQLVGLSGGGGGGDVTLTVSDIQIGAVEIKDGVTDMRTTVMDTCPVGTEPGIVTRAIPCGTQPISAASLPLPTGAATEATLSDLLISSFGIETCVCGSEAILSNISGTQLPANLGQKTMLASFPVVIASNQSAIPVTFGTFMTTCPVGTESGLIVRAVPCGTQAISAASLPLPAGAATESTLDQIATNTGNLPALGQAAMSGSLPVVIASDQTPVKVTHAYDATYGAFTAELTLGTATGRNRILSFFHPVGVTLNYEIIKVLLFFRAKHTAGVGQYKIQFTSAESATGTVLTPQQYHLGDANTGASVRSATTADGTLVGNPFIGYTMSLTPITGDPLGAMVPIYEHPGSPEEKPITLRASTAEGIIVFQDVTATLTTAPILACRIVWRERL